MAGRIPQAFIDELIARTDIVDVVGRRVPLRKAGAEYKACCPFHDEKTPSFTVSPAKQFFHCFGCGAHGTALGFLMEHEHASFVEAVEELAAMVSLQVPREEGAKPGPGAELYEIMERAAVVYRRALREEPAAVAYLKDRGLSGETAARFGIGYAPDRWDTVVTALGGSAQALALLHEAGLAIERRGVEGGYYDRFRGRVMFPIRDARGRVIAFGGRMLGKSDTDQAKYVNSPETPLFHKGRELYALYEVRQASRDLSRLLVVEGYMDVVGLAEHGVSYAVATLGTATTADHLNRIFRVTDSVVFCFDGDRAGRAAAWRALENALPCVREGRQVDFLFLPEGHDPDSLVRAEGAEAFEARLTESLPLSEFLVRQLSEGLDLATVDARARLAERARPLVASLPEGVYRQLLIQRLGEAVRLAPERLEGLLGKPAPAQQAESAPRRATRRVSAGRGNLVRQAITLLLHYPRLAQDPVDLTHLRAVALPGIALLADLVEEARPNPNISTGGLLERWRDRENGRHLAKLAATECLVDEVAAAGEFADLLRRLGGTAPAQRTSVLLAKASAEGLTESEKSELKALLAARRAADPSAGRRPH